MNIKYKINARKQNLVVEDPIPAGFEIINKKFQNETGINPNARFTWYTQEIYSDNIILFPWGIEPNKTKMVRYFARVIHPGTYTVLSPFVQAMYEVDYPAYGKLDTITVLE